MAQIINLRESEYQTIVSELSNMHTNQMDKIREIIGDLNELVTSKTTFSADMVSENITNMLAVLSDSILPLLEQTFQDSEAGVANMITSTTVTDTACD